MVLRYMEIELSREPGNVVDWVRYAGFGLRHLLSTHRTLCRDGNAVLVISHLHHWVCRHFLSIAPTDVSFGRSPAFQTKLSRLSPGEAIIWAKSTLGAEPLRPNGDSKHIRCLIPPPDPVGNQLDDILFAPNGIQAFEYRTLRLLTHRFAVSVKTRDWPEEELPSTHAMLKRWHPLQQPRVA